MFVRRGRFVGFVLLVAVAGCGGGSASAPKTLPPLPSATSTTPAPAGSPLSKQAELAAATHVVREYFRLLNAPTTVPNARKLSNLMTASCTCRRVARSTLQVARRGETYFGSASLRGLTPVMDSATQAEVLARYDLSAGGIRRHDGEVVTRTSARNGIELNFTAVLHEDKWLIARVAIVKAGSK